MKKTRHGMGKMRHYTELELRSDKVCGLTGCMCKSDRFETEKDVIDYFTVENMVYMFGECDDTQDDLDEIAGLILNYDDGTFTTFKNVDAELTEEEARSFNKMEKFHGAVAEGDNWTNAWPKESRKSAALALEWLRDGDEELAAEYVADAQSEMEQQ